MTARVATHTPNDVINLCSDAPTVRGLSNRRYERLDGICQLGFRLRRSGINLSFDVKLVKDVIIERFKRRNLSRSTYRGLNHVVTKAIAQ